MSRQVYVAAIIGLLRLPLIHLNVTIVQLQESDELISVFPATFSGAVAHDAVEISAKRGLLLVHISLPNFINIDCMKAAFL